ncbi:hypothetical protein [Microbacterium suwonense]|uniref:hypothetical protein n=1 Tax=Microbacterium suwonense TaxID=683047 RepID=UPI002574319A|nr:hypothetical protein [Microbacterium suwonense]
MNLVESPENGAYDAIILAVAHREFIALGATKIHAYGREEHILYDLKYGLPVDDSDLRL